MSDIIYPEYSVGTVFISTYHDIDTNLSKKGLFVIYYDEQTDLSTGNRKHNVLAFKLTTNPRAVTGHSFLLEAKEHKFLSRDCYILATKTYLFHKKFVSRVLGILDTETLTNFFYNSYVQAQLSVSSQIINKIKGDK